MFIQLVFSSVLMKHFTFSTAWTLNSLVMLVCGSGPQSTDTKKISNHNETTCILFKNGLLLSFVCLLIATKTTARTTINTLISSLIYLREINANLNCTVTKSTQYVKFQWKSFKNVYQNWFFNSTKYDLIFNCSEFTHWIVWTVWNSELKWFLTNSTSSFYLEIVRDIS